MISKIFFIVFCHLFADCVLQPERHAMRKQFVLRYMITHVIIYSGTVGFLLGLSFWQILLILISHYLIDTYLPKYPGFSEDVEKTGIAGWIDQSLHIGFLMGVSLI